MTVSEKIIIAEISQYQSLNVINKFGLFGGGEDLNLPRKLYLVRKGVQRAYGNNPNDDTLVATSSMMFALCGAYQFTALAAQSSGGSVAPISPDGRTVNPLDFIVSASSIIPTGGTSILLDGTNGNPDFRGYDVNFARGGTTQYTTPQSEGALYYGWNRVTGLFQLLGTNPEAAAGESFRIMPDTGSASSSASSGWTSFIITSADFESDGVTYNSPTIVGFEVSLTPNNFNGNFLSPGNGLTMTGTGLIVTDPAFNATLFDYTVKVEKLN